MTENEAVAQAAEKYRADGYTVTLTPDPALLPPEVKTRRLALLATKNGTSVVLEVWSRDRVNDLPPTFMPPGWHFDIISLPSTVPPDAPGPGPAPTAEFANRLIVEVEEYVPRAALRARFLLAWSAVESAMRVASLRVGLDPARVPPRQLMSELASAGVLSTDQHARLREASAVRNQVAHGVPTDDPDPARVDEMLAIARGLLAEPAVSAA